jgi:hypothetical protein
LGLLSATGVYVLPDSKEEDKIKRYIASANEVQPTEEELSAVVSDNFCISNKEAERLVHKYYLERGPQ